MENQIWQKGDDYHPDDAFPRAGIHILAGGRVVHGNAIECYGSTMAEAQERRDLILGQVDLAVMAVDLFSGDNDVTQQVCSALAARTRPIQERLDELLADAKAQGLIVSVDLRPMWPFLTEPDYEMTGSVRKSRKPRPRVAPGGQL